MALLTLLILAIALQGTALAPARDLALNRLALYGLGALAFTLAAKGGRRRGGLATGAALLLLLGVVAAALSLLVTDWSAGQLLPGLPLSERFPVRFQLLGSGVPNPADGANPRMVAGAMALILPLAFSLALFARCRSLRLLGALAGLALLFPLYLSQSPQGLLALALGLGLVLAWLWLPSLLLQGGLFTLVIAAWQFWRKGLPEPLVNRLLIGIQDRLQIWPIGLAMLGDMPFSGIGLNNFPTIQPLYDFELALLPHAHNTFLQTALDLGIFGLAAFAGLLATAFAAGWRAYHRLSDPDERAVVLGCAGGLAAYLGYGLWDMMSLGNKPAVAVWALLGLLSAAGRLAERAPGTPPAKVRRAPRRPVFLLVGLGLLVALIVPLWGSAALVNAGRALYHPMALPGGEVDPARLAQVEWLGVTAAHLSPRNGRAFFLQGYAAALGGQDARARLAFECGLALEPADAHARLALADTCMRMGVESCALQHWRAAGTYELLVGRGIEQYQAQVYPQAAAWFERAVAVEPTRSDAWRRWLSALKAQSEWSAALQVALDFREAFPALSAPYEELVTILLQLDQLEEAAETVAQGFQNTQPPGAGLYYLRSRQSAAGQDYPRAEMDARQAIALAPSRGDYLAWLGELYQRQGRHAEALAQYERTAREASAPDWAWRAAQRVGALYAAQGRWGEALAYYRRALALSQEQGAAPALLAQSYVLLGDTLRQVGDRSEAALAYQQALELDSNNQVAAAGLAELVP